MAIYNLDILPSQFGTSLLLCVCFLTCIQISQEAGQVVWYSHLFKNVQEFVVIHTVKGFGIVNKAEVDIFLELSCFFLLLELSFLFWNSLAFSYFRNKKCMQYRLLTGKIGWKENRYRRMWNWSFFLKCFWIPLVTQW